MNQHPGNSILMATFSSIWRGLAAGMAIGLCLLVIVMTYIYSTGGYG